MYRQSRRQSRSEAKGVYKTNRLPKEFVYQMIIDLYLGKMGQEPLSCQEIFNQHNFGLSVRQLQRIVTAYSDSV